MGRSAKEACRPPQACDGGGLVRPSKIEVQNAESSGIQRTKARQAAGSKTEEGKQEAAQEFAKNYEGKSGIEKTGQAISDIITTRAERKKEQ